MLTPPRCPAIRNRQSPIISPGLLEQRIEDDRCADRFNPYWFDYQPITVGLYLEMSEMERVQSPNDSYWGLDISLSSCGKYQDIVRAPLPPPECTDKPKSEEK